MIVHYSPCMAYLRKLQSGRWQSSVRKKGHKPTSKTFRTKASAEAWARTLETEIERGEAVSTHEAGKITVADLLDWYEEQSRHKKGIHKERSRYKILKKGLGEKTLADLSPGDIVDFAKGRGVGSDTIRRDLSVLSSAIEAMRTLRGVTLRDNAAMTATRMMTSSRVLKRKVRRERRLSLGDELALLRECGRSMQLLIAFDLETAMRRGELAKMDWKHIDERSMLIPDDKTGKSTTIPLSLAAMQILDAVGREESGSVWGMRPDSITQAFNRACSRASIDDLRFHDLRHEATSRLFEAGLSIEEVASITRHSDWRSLKIYTHPSIERIASKLG